jgi:transcriptional regulator
MAMNDEGEAGRFIAAYPFGLLVSPSLAATHLPFILAPQEGDKGTLYGHVARANPQWKEMAGQRVLVVFSGPHAYITP